MAYEGERKRSNAGREVVQRSKVTFMQGLKLWANQWRWSEIKKMWHTEYARVQMGTYERMDRIKEKVGR